jgi:two-component sensor histidine kinase
VRDQKDFMWILYQDCVQRFDGKQVKEFRLKTGMLSMICDEDNRIWCTSVNQVYRFKNDHEGFVPMFISDSLKKTIGYVFKLSDGRTYLHTSIGFYVFNEKQQVFIPFPVLFNKTHPIDITRMTSKGSTIFFSAGDSVYSYNVPGKKLRGLPTREVFSINALNEHLVLLSNWQLSSYWYDFEKNKIEQIKPGQLSGGSKSEYLSVNGLVALDKNQYLITTRMGLVKYDLTTKKFKKLVLYYQGQVLHEMENLGDIYLDPQRNVWVSFDQGLVYFSADGNTPGLMRNAATNDRSSTWNNNVRKLAEDEKGNIWFASGNGFNYWDLSTGKFTNYSGKINDNNALYPSIRGITYDGRYVVAGPTNFGIWIFDTKLKKFKRPDYQNDSALRKKSEADFINDIRLLKNGDQFISARDAVYVLKARTHVLKELHFDEGNRGYIFAYQDAQSRIWISAKDHLYCCDTNYHVLLDIKPVGGDRIGCIWQKSDHEYFLGTEGLYLLDIASTPCSIKKIDAYFDKFVLRSVYQDKKQRLWIATDDGLFLYDPATRRLRSLDYANNLQGKGFYNQGMLLSSNGIIFNGGTNGINYFRPENIAIEEERLQPTILNMVVNDDDSSFLKTSAVLRLRYFQNSIRFDFVAPYFNNADKVQYRYMLEGLDNKWKPVGNNTSVYITSLAAGNYHFKVAASANGSDWYESSTIHFMITPPFWQTWWFYLSCFVVVIGVVYLIYRYRIRQLMKLQRVRNRISSELHDDIGTKLTNINILSTLTNQAIEEPVKAKELLHRISSEVQTSSEALDDIVWNINTSNDSLQEIIPRMRRYASEVLSGKEIQFITRVPDNIQQIKFPMEKRHDVYLMFKEIINNVHKHSNASQVKIEIEMHDARFSLRVRDNGNGFDPDQPTNRNGLLNLKMRTARWKGTITIDSQKGQGSDIRIEMPLKNIHSNG